MQHYSYKNRSQAGEGSGAQEIQAKSACVKPILHVTINMDADNTTLHQLQEAHPNISDEDPKASYTCCGLGGRRVRNHQ